jgi:hypothetical protein
MSKKAISVTLDAENLTWLKGRVGASGLRSVSDLLDRLITDARSRRSVAPVTSVVGTIDVDASDPLLLKADATVRDLMDASLGRPLRLREPSPGYDTPVKRRRARRG